MPLTAAVNAVFGTAVCAPESSVSTTPGEK